MTVLIVIEPSGLGRRTAELGLDLAARLRCPAVLQVLLAPAAIPHRTEAGPRVVDTWLAPTMALADRLGVAAATVVAAEHDEPTRAVLRAVAEHACRCLVVGWQDGRGDAPSPALTPQLIAASSVPVLVCREGMQVPLAAPPNGYMLAQP